MINEEEFDQELKKLVYSGLGNTRIEGIDIGISLKKFIEGMAIAAQSKNSNVETISENTIAKCDLKNILLPKDEDNPIKHPSEISFPSGGAIKPETLQEIEDRLYLKCGIPREFIQNNLQLKYGIKEVWDGGIFEEERKRLGEKYEGIYYCPKSIGTNIIKMEEGDNEKRFKNSP